MQRRTIAESNVSAKIQRIKELQALLAEAER